GRKSEPHSGLGGVPSSIPHRSDRKANIIPATTEAADPAPSHARSYQLNAYSLGLNSSVSHRGPLFFGSGSLFVSSRNNRAASEIKSAGGLFEAQETVSWSIKKYSTISSSRIVSLSPVRATSRCGSATRITRWGRSCCTSV